uniref:Signal recognition particle subunit SRP72 n=1 Tax=Neobodo designis TaxID=312471 RepID=A0A7S1MA77_NEODS
MATTQQHQAIAAATEAEDPDHAKIAQLCDRCPKADAFAQYTKGIALLQQGKAAAAQPLLAAVDDLRSPASGVNPLGIRFAHAYCHYKTGAFSQALSLLEEVMAHAKFGARAKADPAVLNLHAQALYNLEKYPEAAAALEAILAAGMYRDDVERSELLTNLSAAYSQFDFAKCQESSRRGTEGDNVTFDGAFNAATGAIEKKDYTLARTLLAQALGLCLHEHGHDVGSTDIVALAQQCASDDCPKAVRDTVRDAAPVMVQQAFVAFATGDEAGAQKLLAPLIPLQDKLPVATYAAACVNWAAVRRHSDFFDTFKRLKYVQQPQVEARLTTRQRLYVKYNTVLLLLGMGGRLNECRRLVDAMVRDDPDSELGALALTAVLVHKDGAAGKSGKTSRAEEHFRAFVAQRGAEDAASTRLTLAQLALERGNVAAALDRIRSAPAAMLKQFPSAVATVAHGYATRVGDVDAAVAVVQAAAAAFAGTPDEDAYAIFAADFYAAHHRDALAAAAYEKVLARAGVDAKQRQRVVAALVRAAARVNPALALKFRDQLPEDAATHADASGAGSGPTVAAMAEVGLRRPTARAQGAVVVKPARTRPMRRPPKIPEGATSAPQMDPERWVPMKQRTYIRDLPARRQRELRRRRASEQEEKRRQAERRKREAAAAAAAAAK